MTMPASSDELSKRELELLSLVATGASNKEIAHKLFISPNTVKVHLRNIFAKIEVSSRTEAAMYAVNAGLVPGAIPTQGAKTGISGEEGGLLQVLRSLEAAFGRRTARVGIGLSLFIVVSIVGSTVYFLWRSVAGAPAGPLSVSEPSRWQTLAPMPTARYGLAVTVYENQIYTIGGTTEEGVTDSVERYDPGLNTWASLAAKPSAVTDVSAVIIGGKVYVPGGRLASGDLTDVLEIYDPLQDNWSRGASLPVALSAYGLAAFEGKLYLFGGRDQDRYLDTVYEYDPAQNNWSAKTPMPISRAYLSTAVVANEIFIIGGKNEDRVFAQNHKYSPHKERRAENPWSGFSPLPKRRSQMGIANLVDTIYVIGGEGENGSTDFLQMQYYPSQDTWEIVEVASHETWSQGGLVVVGTNLHMLGGVQNRQVTNTHLSYQAIYLIHMPLIR